MSSAGSTTLLVSALLTGFVSVCLVGFLARKADDPRELAGWARAHGVALDERTRPVLAYFVRLTILLRVVGGVGGMLLGSLFDDAAGADTSASFGVWVWVLAGWMAGAVWAERHLPRPHGAGVASLTPRRLADYLPIGLRLAPAGGAAAAAAIAGIGLVVRPEARPEAPALALTVAGAATAALMVAWAQRSVVDRRQSVTRPDLVAADDAIRASTVHNLGGGGAALTLLLAADTLERVATAGDRVPVGSGVVIPLLLMVVALGVWRFWSHRAWRVRRPASRVVVGS